MKEHQHLQRSETLLSVSEMRTKFKRCLKEMAEQSHCRSQASHDILQVTEAGQNAFHQEKSCQRLHDGEENDEVAVISRDENPVFVWILGGNVKPWPPLRTKTMLPSRPSGMKLLVRLQCVLSLSHAENKPLPRSSCRKTQAAATAMSHEVATCCLV